MRVSALKLLRVEARLTQRELAESAGVDPSYISTLENQPDKNITLGLARKLGRVLSERLNRPVSVLDIFPDNHEGSQGRETA